MHRHHSYFLRVCPSFRSQTEAKDYLIGQFTNNSWLQIVFFWRICPQLILFMSFKFWRKVVLPLPQSCKHSGLKFYKFVTKRRQHLYDHNFKFINALSLYFTIECFVEIYKFILAKLCFIIFWGDCIFSYFNILKIHIRTSNINYVLAGFSVIWKHWNLIALRIFF